MVTFRAGGGWTDGQSVGLMEGTELDVILPSEISTSRYEETHYDASCVATHHIVPVFSVLCNPGQAKYPFFYTWLIKKEKREEI